MTAKANWPRDPGKLALLESKSLELAALCDQKAATLRKMAEACAAERLGAIPARWHREAEDIATRLERDAARSKPGTYKAASGAVIACAWLDGRVGWTLAGEAIARRAAVFYIAERMQERLGKGV